MTTEEEYEKWKGKKVMCIQHDGIKVRGIVVGCDRAHLVMYVSDSGGYDNCWDLIGGCVGITHFAENLIPKGGYPNPLGKYCSDNNLTEIK